MQNNQRRVFAVLLAGGNGSRFNSDVPKQFHIIGGKTVLERSLEALSSSYSFYQIVLVADASLVGSYMHNSDLAHLLNECLVAKPGLTRQESVFNALNLIKAQANFEEDDRVLIHDAARCLATKELFSRVLDSEGVAATTAIKLSDSIKLGNYAGSAIIKSLSREDVFTIQTPQIFKLKLLHQTHLMARSATPPFLAADDDCQLIERYAPESEIKIVKGERFNLKLTYHEDIPLFEALSVK